MRTLEGDIKKRHVWYVLPDGSRGISQVLKVSEAATKVRIPDGSQKSSRVSKIFKLASKLRIPGTSTTVSEYFRDQYRTILKWPNMPCIRLSSNEKEMYIPVEFCRMTTKPLPGKTGSPGHKLEENLFNVIAKQGQGGTGDAGPT